MLLGFLESTYPDFHMIGALVILFVKELKVVSSG